MFLTSVMNTRYGRSDRIRTCGIDVPNVARYQLRHTPMCDLYLTFIFSVRGQTVRTLIGRGLYYSKVFFDCQVCGEKSIENFPALSWQGFFHGGLIRDDCPPPLSEIVQDRLLASFRLLVKKQTHQGGSLQKDVSDFLLNLLCKGDET